MAGAACEGAGARIERLDKPIRMLGLHDESNYFKLGTWAIQYQ